MSESQPGQVAAKAIEQARAEISSGNSAAAVALVRQAVGRADTQPDQLAEAGTLAAHLGMEEAFTWLMRAGRLQLDARSLDAARETLTAARTLDQKNYEPIFELGRVEIAAGNKAEGLGRFAEVLRKSNYTFVPALFEAGCVYEEEGSTDQAILTFKRIVERDKNHSQALAHLGRLHRAKQMAPEATSYLLTAAEAARKVMDYTLALQCARDILEFDPANARASGLESEMLRVAPEPRTRAKAPPPKESKPAPAPPPAPPPVAHPAAAPIVPPDYKLIEEQSKATLELAQVTASVAEAYKQRTEIQEQMKQAQAALEAAASARASADAEMTAIRQQLESVARARTAEEASLAAVSAKLEHTRSMLVALEALHENVKQADGQRLGVLKAIEQMRADSANAKIRAEKAKSSSEAVEKQLAEFNATFAAVRKETEAAKAALDDAKARADKAKANASAADHAVDEARARFDAARAQFELAEKDIAHASARARALSSDASAALSGLGSAEREMEAALSAQEGIEDAISQLRALASALTERRKQTEAALSQIQGMGTPQPTKVSDAEISKLEAGLAAAIEKAAAARQAAPRAPAPPPPPPPPPPAAPAPAAGATAATRPNGAPPAPPVSAKPGKGEGAKAAEQPAKGDKYAEAYARAASLLEGNKPKDALKLLESLQAVPEYAITAQTAIGRCYARMGKLDEAVQHYSKALETPGHPEEQYHEALYFMADAHESRDDAESRELALWSLEEIVAGNPGYRDVAERIESLKARAGKAPTGPA